MGRGMSQKPRDGGGRDGVQMVRRDQRRKPAKAGTTGFGGCGRPRGFSGEEEQTAVRHYMLLTAGQLVFVGVYYCNIQRDRLLTKRETRWEVKN